MGKKQTLKYSNLWSYKDDPDLNLEICLSELIDNSISSFQKNQDKIDWKELDIYLESYRKKDGSRHIIVEDNAFGMSKDELDNCIELYKDNKAKGSNTMNQYGIGLKHAIFWIGDNAEILTKQKKGKSLRLYFEPFNKQLRLESTEFESEIEKIDLNPIRAPYTSGTKITIDCLPNKSSVYWTDNSESQNRRIKSFLGKKYAKYILGTSNFKLNLHFLYRDEERPNNVLYEKIEASKFNENPLILSKKINNYDNPEIINSIRELYNNSVQNKDEITNLLFNKFINNEPMELEYTFKIADVDAKSKISFLPNPNQKDSGLIICHNSRYIYFPLPKETNTTSTYEYYSDSRKFIDGHHKWVQIELNLEDIEGNEKCDFIKPDAKKTKLLFDDSENSKYTRENFDKSVQNFVQLLNPFIKFLILLNNDSRFKDNKLSNSEFKQGYSNNNSITSITTSMEIDENNDNVMVIDDNYKIQVRYKNDIDSDEIIIYNNRNDEEKKLDVTINIESKWINGKDKTSWALLLLYFDLFLKSDTTDTKYIAEEGQVKNILKKIWSKENKC